MNQRNTLIMGIGNYLMCDEGIGVHVAKSISMQQWPENVFVLDGGTGGFHLLEYFEKNDHLVLIDATLDDQEPGTIRKITPRFAKDFPPAMSTHDIGLKDMVSALQLMGKMPEIDLFVVSISTIQDQGIELTPKVKAAIPELIRRIRAIVSVNKQEVES